MKDIVVSWDTAGKTQCFYGKLFSILSLYRSDFIQSRNKNYKNLSKRNFALSKIDNLNEYFLPIFVIFIEQIKSLERLKLEAHIQVIGLICLSFVH